MNTNIEQEKIFFNYFLSNPKYLKELRVSFFGNEDLRFLAKIALKFFEEYQEPPTKAQIKPLCKNVDEDFDLDVVDAIYNVDLKEYDEDWLKSSSESWLKYQVFHKELTRTVEYVKTTKITPNNISEVLAKATSMISVDGNVNFNNDFGLNFFNPDDHKQDVVKTIPSGWNFIDEKVGGYDQKTLVVYCGKPNVGKSIFLCQDAAKFIKDGYNVLFVTCEMSSQKVLKRIGSNLLKVPMSEYSNFVKDKETLKRKLSGIKSNNGIMPIGKLWIKEYPTSQATTLDLDAYLKEFNATHDYNIDVVVLDYINIMSNWRNPNGDSTYMKIKQIAEDLRALAIKYKCLIVSATQISRSTGGGWDSTDMTMESIAESAGLAATADTILGIIQDSIMYSQCEYWLKVLKIRDGEGKDSKCKLSINYDFMRLTETDEIIT